MKTTAQSFINFYQTIFSINSSTPKVQHSKTALILAPHPDDECLMGPFALRLKIENNSKVIACAFSLGSNTARQKERAQEFLDACSTLDFHPEILDEDEKKKEKLIQLIQSEQIDLIIAPHLKDHHPTHIKAGELARDVIKSIKFNGLYLESEFWGELENPNLLIEVTKETFIKQFEALTKHTGEIQRNPYHLRLAANLVNNVRRGAEKVSSLGSSAPQFAFGSLYQGYQVKDGELYSLPTQILDYAKDLSSIF
ncbi:MAG: PIG-L family deacetylase [Candidatus Caldatribacteriota bacterium]